MHFWAINFENVFYEGAISSFFFFLSEQFRKCVFWVNNFENVFKNIKKIEKIWHWKTYWKKN